MADFLNPKAWILDTDIGWDPDDILAILIIVKYVIESESDQLLLISSAETEGNGRAKVLQTLLNSIYEDLQLSSRPNDRIRVVAGNPPNHADGVTNRCSDGLRKITEAEPSPLGGFPNYGCPELQSFITENRAMDRKVIWIGIGAMTNLAMILDTNTIPSKVVQMGGCVDEAEFNIKLDPAACMKTIERCKEKGIPLKFVTLDTTGFNLRWLHPVSEEQNISGVAPSRRSVCNPNRCDLVGEIRLMELYREFLAPFESVRQVILANITPNTIGALYYHAGSSLHDPLTVVDTLLGEISGEISRTGVHDGDEVVAQDTAVSTIDESSSSSSSSSEGLTARLVQTIDALVTCNPTTGMWVTKIPKGLAEDICTQEGESDDKEIPSVTLKAWWDYYGNYYEELRDTDECNCTISLGPLSQRRIESFNQKVKEILRIR